MLTEDNLPSYHSEITIRLGRDGAWGAWVHRWTAEEDRHSFVLRAILLARRAVDPVVLEDLRLRNMASGWSPHNWFTPLHTLAYATVQELATRHAHRNTGALCGDRLGERLMTRIAADENLHMLFYRELLADAFQVFPDDAMTALADVLRDFRMPGAAIPGFGSRAARVAAAGIYNPDIHHEHVVAPLLRTLPVLAATELGPVGRQAQERVLGWDIGSHGFRIVLSAEIPALVENHLPRAVRELLSRHGLTTRDVGSWIVHGAGPKVFTAVERAFALPPQALELTRRSVAAKGNLSSVSVLDVLCTAAKAPPPRGTPGLVVAMGPGFAIELALIRW
ncbi:acyl-ACP desaturase [Streptomyces sp. I05A-00742]|uniref:acyl-ACP desaturase n=1 Tax=Streptomyces sp. I05A-00742 TaxID=2732853 RepID=UPI0028985EF6|nr:acyl-ACP desaturase [Streptomyces sp. I05A-00742]